MSLNLKKFLVRLATDPDSLAEFIAQPERAMARVGLSAAEQAVLVSGDQGAIYTALTTEKRPVAD